MSLSRRALLGGGAALAGLGTIGSAGIGWAGSLLDPVPITPPVPNRYTLATDDTGGTFYAVGTGLATLVKMRIPPEQAIDLSARSTSGSDENLRLMLSGQAQFGILQALYGHWARTGTGTFEGRPTGNRIRAMTALWPDVEHFILSRSLAPSGTVEDVRNLQHGAHFSIGASRSGVAGSTRYILDRLGGMVGPPDTLVELSTIEATSALLMGRLAGMSLPGGVPITTVNAVISHDPQGLRILEFTDRQLRIINDGLDLWHRYVVPRGTYTGQEWEIQSIAQPTFLAVDERVPDKDVYAILAAMFDNLDILRFAHRAAEAIDLNDALSGLPMRLHPGATRFFTEKGIVIPSALAP